MEVIKNQMEANMKSLMNVKIEMQDDEYQEGEILYCKKCKTARTVINLVPPALVDKLGDKRIARCNCKCQSEKIKEEEKIKQEIANQVKISKLQEASLLSDRYKNVTFENCITGRNESFDAAFERCKKFCENSDKIIEKGFGIYLWGDKGTGKTHLTACMANNLIRQYKQVFFTNFFEIGKSIRATFKGKGNEIDLINKIANVDFLFIDDLGTEKVTRDGEDTWLQEKIFEVINKRYNNMKPTIFTSNYSISSLVKDRGLMDKTVDRILEMSTAIIKVEGKSNRSTRIENNIF